MNYLIERIKKMTFLEITLSGVLFYIVYIYVWQAMQVDVSSPFVSFVDDAFIHLRFIDHFARGYGFVWNIGDAPVEGFTSFLYVVFLGAFERLGGSPIAVMPYIGACGAVLSLFATLWLLEYLNPNHRAENMVAVIMLGLSPQLRFWSFSGLEITVYTLLLVLSVVIFLGYRVSKFRPWWVGAMFGILALVRPEALGLFIVTVVYDMGLDVIENRFRFKKTLVILCSFGIIFLPVFVWKWWYFGYPFPNTYYAKTGAGWIQVLGGYNYLKESLKQIVKGSLVPVLLALFTFQWKTHKDRAYLLVLIIAICGIIILNGGDHFGQARFLVPGLPFIFVLMAIGLSQITGLLPFFNRVVLFFVILSMTFLVWNPFRPLVDEKIIPMELDGQANRSKLEFFNNWDAGFIIMGRTLHKIAKPYDSIAVVPIGAIGYYSDIKVFDMVGLVDPVIAHEPFDLDYVSSWRPGHDKGDGLYILSKHPTYIQLVDVLSSLPYSKLLPSSEQYKSVLEIWNAPEFLQLYEYYPVQVDGGWYYNLYHLKDDYSS